MATRLGKTQDLRVLATYRDQRLALDDKQETFIATLRRVGAEPFKAAANGARFSAAQAA